MNPSTQHVDLFGPIFAALPIIAQIYALPLMMIVLLFALKYAYRRYRRSYLLDSQRSLETLRAMSWQDFEALVAETYDRQGYQVTERGRGGKDGGVDIELRKGPEKVVVQCKRWKTSTVGVPIVRELLGSMTAEHATGGAVVTCGRFTSDAIHFAKGKPITLIDGPRLLSLVQSVQHTVSLPTTIGTPASTSKIASPWEPSAASAYPKLSGNTVHESVPPLIAAHLHSVEASYSPVCPRCGSEMIRRTAQKGANVGQDFWGCPGYPRCRGTRPI